MLSSYAKAINNQEKRVGSLFQQNTKRKLLVKESSQFNCFHYIHQNPVKSGLVERTKDWEMSSYKDYAGLRKGSLCDLKIAYEFLDIPEDPALFVRQSEG